MPLLLSPLLDGEGWRFNISSPTVGRVNSRDVPPSLGLAEDLELRLEEPCCALISRHSLLRQEPPSKRALARRVG